MKKNSKVKQSPKRASARKQEPITIGMDLGDRTSRYCVLGAQGEVESEGSGATTRKAMLEKFGRLQRCRIAIEVGTHSPWLSRDSNEADPFNKFLGKSLGDQCECSVPAP